MEIETTTRVPVERLRLDRRNPRLIGGDEEASDEAIITRLYLAADLGELLQSIAANGYMDIEPLVVVVDPDSENDDLTVLEGNRRLAALRLLREPDLAHGSGRRSVFAFRSRLSTSHSETPSTKCRCIASPIASARDPLSASSTSTAQRSGMLTRRPALRRNGTSRGEPRVLTWR